MQPYIMSFSNDACSCCKVVATIINLQVNNDICKLVNLSFLYLIYYLARPRAGTLPKITNSVKVTSRLYVIIVSSRKACSSTIQCTYMHSYLVSLTTEINIIVPQIMVTDREVERPQTHLCIYIDRAIDSRSVCSCQMPVNGYHREWFKLIELLMM